MAGCLSLSSHANHGSHTSTRQGLRAVYLESGAVITAYQPKPGEFLQPRLARPRRGMVCSVLSV